MSAWDSCAASGQVYLRVFALSALVLLTFGCQGESLVEPYDDSCMDCEPELAAPVTGDCTQIRGSVFWALSDDTPSRGTQVSQQRLHFNNDKVTWWKNNAQQTGDYACDLHGKIYLSFTSDMSSMIPILLSHDGKKLRMIEDKGYSLYLLDTPSACDIDAAPVCGKENTNLRCLIAPCDTHTYYTYGNECEAREAKASIAFEGECGDLEQHVAPEAIPVAMTDELYWNTSGGNTSGGNTLGGNTLGGNKSTQPKIVDYAIEENRLRVALQYSACNEAIFLMYADKTFSNQSPEQVNYRFVPDFELDLSCNTSFVSEFTFDLLPIAEHYRRLYPNGEREVVLPDIGGYRLPY